MGKDAMLALLKVINEANAYLRMPNLRPSALLLRAIATYASQILKVFGVINGADDFGFRGGSDGKGEVADNGSEPKPIIEAMVSFRENVRNAALAAVKGGDTKHAIQSILQICDGFRDETLPTLGVRLEDRPSGTMWNVEDPAAMQKEAQVGKLEKQLAARMKEVEKLKSSMVKPQDLFRTAEFKEWDESGVPLTLANGDSVSGGQLKKKKKAIDKQAKAYKDLMQKSGNNPQESLESAQKDVASVKARLDKLSL